MPVPQKIFVIVERASCPLLWKNRQDACSTKNFLLLWKNRQDACSTKNFVIVEEQARCLFHKKFCYCGRTGKMPVPQKIFCYCGTGILPVQYFLEILPKNYKFMKNCIKIRNRIYNSTINSTCLKKPIANG
ncbi:hypothetical protein QUB20_21040 [Microcoleus sp. B4-C2]